MKLRWTLYHIQHVAKDGLIERKIESIAFTSLFRLYKVAVDLTNTDQYKVVKSHQSLHLYFRQEPKHESVDQYFVLAITDKRVLLVNFSPTNQLF